MRRSIVVLRRLSPWKDCGSDTQPSHEEPVQHGWPPRSARGTECEVWWWEWTGSFTAEGAEAGHRVVARRRASRSSRCLGDSLGLGAEPGAGAPGRPPPPPPGDRAWCCISLALIPRGLAGVAWVPQRAFGRTGVMVFAPDWRPGFFRIPVLLPKEK